MSRKKKKKSNLELAAGFIGLFIFIVIVSLALKFFWLVGQSRFDGDNKFNLAVYDNRGVSVISFSPKEKSISTLKLENRNYKNLAQDLQIPIDSSISTNDENFNYANISGSLLKSLIAGSNRDGLTFLDVFRLSLYSRTVSPNFTYERKLTKQETESIKTEVLVFIFKDPAILSEGKSIEIVNSTGVAGLGGRLANLVTYMGGNVVLVSTSENTKKSRIIYFENEGYTVKKLSDYLGFPKEKGQRRDFGDVIIVIGEDSLEKLKF